MLPIKTLILISFIFAFNLNTALSNESDDNFLTAAEIKEFQTNGFLKSKFFVESMNNDENQFILNGKLKTKLIAKIDTETWTEIPAHIELIFADSLLNDNQLTSCIITGTIIEGMSNERFVIRGNKLICNNSMQKGEQNIRAFFQDGDDTDRLEGVAVSLGKRDLTKNELSLIEQEASKRFGEAHKQALLMPTAIFETKDKEHSILIILPEQTPNK
jgi:hypothetical protein